MVLAVILLEKGTNDSRMVQLMLLPVHFVCLIQKVSGHLTFLVPALPGFPGKEAVKQVLLSLQHIIC